MAIALLTAVIVSIAGICYSAVVGLRWASDADLLRHVTFGVFSTMLALLAHSMTMFYLIGKGRAVRDAAREGGLSDRFAADVARLRGPVFRIGTLAMGLTMITAILGASVDTKVLAPGVHGALSYLAIAANLWALRVEAAALTASARIVAEVDRLLEAG